MATYSDIYQTIRDLLRQQQLTDEQILLNWRELARDLSKKRLPILRRQENINASLLGSSNGYNIVNRPPRPDGTIPPPIELLNGVYDPNGRPLDSVVRIDDGNYTRYNEAYSLVAGILTGHRLSDSRDYTLDYYIRYEVSPTNHAEDVVLQREETLIISGLKYFVRLWQEAPLDTMQILLAKYNNDLAEARRQKEVSYLTPTRNRYYA